MRPGRRSPPAAPTLSRRAHLLTMFLMNRFEPITRESTAVQMASEPPTRAYSALSSSTTPSERSATAKSDSVACAGSAARTGAVSAATEATSRASRF